MITAPYVAVVGAGGAVAAELLALAEEVGAELGRRGAIVVTGGLGGVMEAACRGARAAGATTLGILPGPDRTDANAFVDVAVATGMGELRNGLVVRCADALVAVGGEYGTLSEIALALKAGKPVAGLGTWRIDGVQAAADPREAVALVLARGVNDRGGHGLGSSSIGEKARSMEQRISLVTLGVADLARAKSFYEQLGWHGQEVQETVFVQAAGMALVLWGRDKLAADCGLPEAAAGGFGGIVLAHNVRSPGEVDEIVGVAAGAGATVTRPPGETFYGGYAGVFTDPDGHAWEIAYNPGFRLDEDGALTLPDFGAA